MSVNKADYQIKKGFFEKIFKHLFKRYTMCTEEENL